MSLDKSIIQRNFDRHAHEYDHNARIQNRVAHELISRNKDDLKGDILDIGSGTGIISQITGLQPTQIDISQKMCEISGSICADAEELPFKDESFDFVISSLTIQWLDDLKQLCSEIKRVLKPGGRFALSSFSSGTLQELNDCYSYLDQKKHLINFTSSMQIFAAMKMAGLEGVEIHSQNIVYQHRNLKEILNSMRKIGATYPVNVASGLKGKKYFEKLENIYKAKFEKGGTIPVTWQAIYISGRK